MEDLAAEATDMLRPADPRRITAADFVRRWAPRLRGLGGRREGPARWCAVYL